VRAIPRLYFLGSDAKAPASMVITERPVTSPCSDWRRHLQILLPLLGLYLAFALYGLDRQSLWEDEYYSLWRVTESKYPVWKDGHGFLYFALLKGWIGFGTSEVVLRSLSVLLGALAVCLTYATGITLLNRRAAAIATVLLATSPYFIWYSQEARYITLMIAASLLSTYSFLRLLTRSSFAWWLSYGAATLVALFSFLSTLLVPVLQGLYLLTCPSGRRLLRKWAACQLLVVVLFGWWFVNGTHFLRAFMHARDSGQNVIGNPLVFPFTADFNEVSLAVLPYTFFVFSAGFTLGPSPREIYADRTLAPLVPHAPLVIVLGVLYAGLLSAGFFALRRRPDSGLFLLLWITVPTIGAFAIAALLNIYFDVRYVAMIFPAYIFVLAAGIAASGQRGVQALFFGAVLMVQAVALANYYFDPRYTREDTRAAARYLESVAGPNDLVLIVGTASSLPHYYRGTLPLVDVRDLPTAAGPLKQSLAKLAANHQRVWLVQIRPWQVDRPGTIKEAFDATFHGGESQHFSGVEIYSYQSSQ
jgi:mannosyltransferase